MPKERKSVQENQSPEQDKYLTARLIAKFSHHFGDRGSLAVGIYTHLRWIDNLVDLSPQQDHDKVEELLKRQQSIIQGSIPNDLSEDEKRFTSLPWETLSPEMATYIRDRVGKVIETMHQDNLHKGSVPRSESDIRKYNVDTFLSCIEILSMMINHKELKTSAKFADLVDDSMRIIALRDLGEDLSNNMLQVGFTPAEMSAINELPTAAQRTLAVLEIYNQQKFTASKRSILSRIRQNSPEFLRISIPLWQRVLSYIYMQRAQVKAHLTVHYPNDTAINEIKKRALCAKTGFLVTQDRAEVLN